MGLPPQGLSPKGTVPLPSRQRGYLLVTVIITLFLIASIAVLLSHDSAISANTSSKELETARADYVARAGMQHALWRTQNNACMGDVTIPDTALGADSYDATITGASAGTMFTLGADQDAWIRSDDVTRNNGTGASNHIKQETGNVEQVLTRFDVSSIPAGAKINSAIAWFHLKAGKDHPEGPINVHEVTADWVETAVTWESFAGSYRAERIATLPAQDAGDVWAAINITGLVQAWVNGQPNFGILFDTQAEGIHTEYTAREDGTNPPRLEVVVGSGNASPVTINASGTLDNGVSRTLQDNIATAYQPPTVTTIQPGTEGKDSGVRAAQPNDNFGVAIEVAISGGANPEHLLAQFPVEQVPKGSRIVSARLEMHLNWLSSADPAAEFSVHRMTQPWTEGSGDNWNPGDGASWSTSNGSNAWDWQSNHDAAVAVDTTVVDPSFSGWHSWDITALAQQWATGDQPNYGMVIKGNANTNKAWFRSSDYSDPLYHPRLIVEYACECGSPCMAPQGSGNVLMVVDSTTSPWGEDIYKRDLLESWGYTVTMLADGHGQSTFDSAIAANEVILVSETIASTDLGTKLGNPAIGIVNTDGWMNDELGFESGNSSNWPVGRSINVTDTSHYITAPFVAGALDIYDADMGGLGIDGAAAPDLQPLADWPTGAGLATLDTGAMTAGGTATAGQRVMLPFGRDSALYWPKVNNNGHLILKRSLDWAMGIGKVDAGKLLLVVADAANPVTSETDRKSLIESWGYEVTLISDHASQGEFDTALADADVAYITGSGSSADVNTKLTAATIGVLSEDMGLVDVLGIAQPAFLKRNSQSIDIFDNTHYVTDGFSLGTLQLYSYVPEIWTVTGLYAPGLQVLAGTESSGSSFPPGLSLLDAGAELWGGGLAAGRRVQLPWAQGSFDINALNDDGKTIMRRAIEWGAGACVSTSPILFVVGDSATPASEDVARQKLMESWCYAVSMIDDDASQADYAAAATINEVIYISGTVEASTILATKISDSGKPIVNEDRYLVADFGFSENEGNSVGHTILTTDNSHYINEPFSGSNAVAFTNYTIMYTLNGTVSADLMHPGQVTSAVTVLGALEAGAQTWDGMPVPARRVYVPFDRAIAGEISVDGQTLMRRSIEWAAGADPYQGPIAHWKLDETSGLTAVDSEGGHDGTLVNGPTWQTGHLDGALNFDGTNDFVNVPHDDNLSLTDVMTFTAWINASSFGASYQTILAKDAGGAGSNYWFGTWQQLPVFGFFSGGLFREVFNPSVELQPNTWYHLAASFDNATGDTNLYVDGALVQNGTLNWDPTAVTADLRIGRSPDGERWRGLLDDVRIYDEILTESDMAELASAGVGGPIAHWKLDDGTGTTAIDSEGGHHGTLTNGPVWVAGQLGDALSFDGSNDLVSIPHHAIFTQVPMTVSAWFNLDTLPTTRSEHGTIIDKRHTDDPYASWTLYVNKDLGNRIRFQIRDSSETGYWLDSAASAVTNTWYHVVGTIDESYNAKLYINGALEPDDDNIGSLFNSNDEIRIGAGWSGGNRLDGAVDDVRFYDRALSATEISGLYTDGTGGGGGGGDSGCSDGGIFRDEFSAQSFSGSDGVLTWATDWIEVGESDGPTSGDIQVRADQSNYQLRTRDNNNGGEGVEREVDLTGASTATLRYDYRRMSLDSTGDYTKVEVSTDGTSWTELTRHQGGTNDSSYQPASHNISGHISATTRIRFRTSSSMGNTDTVWFDNVEVECTP